MRNSTIVAVLVVLIIILGGWYWWSANGGPAMPGMDGTATTTPVGQAGINGSPNQGNLGQPATGQVQQPGGSAAQDQGVGDASSPQQPMADGAEGVVIGSNLALGTDAGALGTHLVAYNGMTLYMFANDTAGHSNCTGSCAANWPPYLVGPEDNVTQVKAGVNGKVDTIVRADADKSIQVTYNGRPLYFYAQDKASGDAKGQGIGGVWYVVKP